MNVGAAPPQIVGSLVAAAAPGGQQTLDLHPELAKYCEHLEIWAKRNQRDSWMDTCRYFALKAPAIASSGLAAVFAAKHWTQSATWLAAAASICVLLDAINPSGQLRNAHQRAFHRLRELQAKLVTEWQIGKLSGKDHDLLAAAILTGAKKDREKIAKDLEAAETSFGQRGRKD